MLQDAKLSQDLLLTLGQDLENFQQYGFHMVFFQLLWPVSGVHMEVINTGVYRNIFNVF